MIPDKYIFNHVPKTGGISVVALFRQKLSDGEISPHLREDELRQAAKGRWEQHRLIAGHFSIRTQSQFARDRYSITWLRHPLKRIVSQYTFSRQAVGADLVIQKAKELTFPEFVRYFQNSPLFIRNVYTHHFAALDLDTPREPEEKTLLLNYAQHNLAAFDLVGICEEFGESVRMLCADLGWAPPQEPPHENASVHSLDTATIDSATKELLVDRNRLDLELYEYAKHLFCAQQQRSRFVGGTKVRIQIGHDRTVRREMTIEEGPSLQMVERNRFIFYPSTITWEREAAILKCSVSPVPAPIDIRILAVSLRFRVLRLIDDLVAGFVIHDEAGIIIFATNTQIEHCELIGRPGHDYVVRAVLEFDCGPGTYTISAALHSIRQVGYHYHWIENAVAFRSGQRVGGMQNGRIRLSQKLEVLVF